MYRRVNSNGFIGLTTLGIVIVMVVFTWVIYGLVRQVYILTDVMNELNASFKVIVLDMSTMAGHMGSMNENMVAMRGSIDNMNGTVSVMGTDITVMTGNTAVMAHDLGQMNGAMGAMTANITRMSSDMNRATHAFSNPMGYMFNGGMFPF